MVLLFFVIEVYLLDSWNGLRGEFLGVAPDGLVV